MKYPIRLVESFRHGKATSILVKTITGIEPPVRPDPPSPGGGGDDGELPPVRPDPPSPGGGGDDGELPPDPPELPEPTPPGGDENGGTVPPVTPPPEIGGRPPETTYQPEHVNKTGIPILYLPSEYLGYDNRYSVEIEGNILNNNHQLPLMYDNFIRDPETLQPYEWILKYPSYNEMDCGASASINYNDVENKALFLQNATVSKLRFTPASDQTTLYTQDGGLRLQEENPEGEFEFFEDGSFTVWMASYVYGQDPRWRYDDDEIFYNRWDTDGGRENVFYLINDNEDLNFEIGFNGEWFNPTGSLLGKTFTSGNYVVTIGNNARRVKVELNYTGVIDDIISNQRLYIRFRPNTSTYKDVYFEETLDPNGYLTSPGSVYWDGVLSGLLDVFYRAEPDAVPPPPPVYNRYTVTTNFNGMTHADVVRGTISRIQARTEEDWNKWEREHAHIPDMEYAFEPRLIKSIKFSKEYDWENDITFSNYTMVVRWYGEGGDAVMRKHYELIGDGSVMYRMKTYNELRAEDNMGWDLEQHPNNQTLGTFLDEQAGRYLMPSLYRSLGHSPSNGTSTISSFSFVDRDTYIESTSATRYVSVGGYFVNTGILTKPGSTTPNVICTAGGREQFQAEITKGAEAPAPE